MSSNIVIFEGSRACGPPKKRFNLDNYGKGYTKRIASDNFLPNKQLFLDIH